MESVCRCNGSVGLGLNEANGEKYVSNYILKGCVRTGLRNRGEMVGREIIAGSDRQESGPNLGWIRSLNGFNFWV